MSSSKSNKKNKKRNDDSEDENKMEKVTTQKKIKNSSLGDGIIGLKNNSLYCYMNACLQCLLSIDSLRDYYINSEFTKFENIKTISNTTDYCDQVSNFYHDAFKANKSGDQVIMNPTGLKNKIRRHFTPSMQHDSHEFLMHLIGELQDEETPADIKRFNGEI